MEIRAVRADDDPSCFPASPTAYSDSRIVDLLEDDARLLRQKCSCIRELDAFCKPAKYNSFFNCRICALDGG
jgi:hypothetical protein